MSSTLTNLTAATSWSGTDLFYATVSGNSRKIAASSFFTLSGSILSTTNPINAVSGTAIPAGGSTTARFTLGSTAGFGIYIGSGVPTVSAAAGSIYLRSDPAGATTRLYSNTDGSTTWTTIGTLFEDTVGAVLAQRAGAATQTFQVYNTFTDSSNYERLALSCSSSAFDIKAETAGTGADNLGIRLTPAGTGQLLFTNAGAVATARIQCTSTSGYAAIDSYNSGGTQTGSFGYGGSATGGSLADRMYMYTNGAIELICRVNSHNHIFATTGQLSLFNDLATPAGGSTAARLVFGSTAGFGIYIGSGAPSVSAAQGSLYLRSNGTGTADRLYVNTNGSTTWTNVVTAL